MCVCELSFSLCRLDTLSKPLKASESYYFSQCVWAFVSPTAVIAITILIVLIHVIIFIIIIFANSLIACKNSVFVRVYD